MTSAFHVLCLVSLFTDCRDFENVCFSGLQLELIAKKKKKKRCAHPNKH